MKLNQTNECKENAAVGTGFTQACLRSCRKLLAALGRVRENVFAESRGRFNAPDRLVQLALNEAEALAWETNYPHLLFPTLATEKVQAVANWSAAQRALRRSDASFALAA